MIIDCEDIEKVKENIPLPSLSMWKGGSDASYSVVKMVEYLSMNPSDLEAHKNNLRMKMIVSAEDYFSSCSTSASNNEDPMKSAFEYVEFLAKYYVASGKANFKDWVNALEWVTKKFHSNNDHVNDNRYIRIWCWYAQCCQDPEIVFQYMLSQGIGSLDALFYESYAEYLGYFKKR